MCLWSQLDNVFFLVQVTLPVSTMAAQENQKSRETGKWRELGRMVDKESVREVGMIITQRRTDVWVK